MKKVFKASILAASVAFAFAANAASVSSTPYKLSEEGVGLGLTHQGAITFDVVVTKEHAATSEIVLTFSDTVDLNNLQSGTCNAPTSGSFACGDVTFNVGTGSFTFDNVVVDADDNTVTFKVNLGNALTANSAFRVTLADTAVPAVPADNAIISGPATVSYASTFNGNAIETGTGTIATTEKQFAVAISTKLDGVIERLERKLFIASPANVDTDSFAFKVTNNTNLLAGASFQDFDVKLMGAFSRKTTPAPGTFVHDGKWLLADRAGVPVTAAGTVATDGKSVGFSYKDAAPAQVAPVAAGTSYDVNFDGAGIVIDPSDFTVDVSVKYWDGVAPASSKTVKYATAADAGEWNLDAAVINVPYLPINYGLSSNVEVANHGDTDAEIMAEGFDDAGKVYAAKVIKTVAKKTVGKVSENDLKAAFGIAADAKVKLNVTFVINQDADKITLVPYYKEGQSRINVMSDQYKADNIR